MSEAMSSRNLANFHSTVWGYHFLSYGSQLTEVGEEEKLELEELKEKMRKMLVETQENSTQQLVLIDQMQQLGVAYHFDSEIEESLQYIFDENNIIGDDNLCFVSLRFRLLRQQGHYISSDVFKKFMNVDGKFNETLVNDGRGLLSLYEAANLMVRGEDILEEALNFTTTSLESMLPMALINDDLILKAQVIDALRQPLRKTLPRLRARKYMSIYKYIDGHNDLLLKFAKLDYNAVQKIHQSELRELTRWWKDLDLAKKYPYARDRLVECCFWINGVYFQPHYSRARKMMIKVMKMTSVIDDTFDAYGILDELVPFADAIQRWDISAMDSVPLFLRPAYQALLEVYNDAEETLAKDGKSERVSYARNEMKKLVRAYLREAQWLAARDIPTCEEHMKNAIVSCGYMMASTTTLMGMEEFISKETFEWITNEPLIVRAASMVNRLMDDIAGHEDEQQRGHVASSVECYMKEYGASKEEAYVKFEREIIDAWKDINQEFLRPTAAPTFVLERVLNFARVMETMYKEEDIYTNSKGKLKNMINLAFVEAVKI